MTYKQLTETIIEIVDNPRIHHQGLTLNYKLSMTKHIDLDKELFYLNEDNKYKDFISQEIIEVVMDGVTIVITREKNK